MAANMDTTTLILRMLQRIDDQRRADEEKFEKLVQQRRADEAQHLTKLEEQRRADHA